jgi:hypothetical protein
MLGAVDVERRNPHRRTPIMRNLVFLYGHRSPDSRGLWHLSPYEFMVYWTVAAAEYPMSRADNEDHAYHATLTTAGEDKLKKQSVDGAPRKLSPGVDYVIKEAPPCDANWLPLPMNRHTEEYRHDWVFQRSCRPRDPSFAHCPMPRHGKDQKDRNAAIVMTYFHPFTLNPEHADDNVPFLGSLCQAGMTWHGSLLHWCDGRIPCQETKRYLDNLFAVTRARPDDDVAENSDEELSDEELDINGHNFDQIVKTRMGAGVERLRTVLEDGQTNCEEEAEVPETIKAAFASAHRMWQIPDGVAQARRPAPDCIAPEDLDKAFAAASSSQRKGYVNSSEGASSRDPSVRCATAYTPGDVWTWYNSKRKETNSKGEPLVKAAQLEMLRVICKRVCDELQGESGGEPLIWMLHGLPGTGKSEVLQMVQELFREVCGWQMGLEYQMAALQVVMAQMLEGDTIHHGLGINPFGQKSDPKSALKASQK